MLYQTLEQYDPEVNDLIEKETWRQFSGLELIASEVSGNFPVVTAEGRLSGGARTLNSDSELTSART